MKAQLQRIEVELVVLDDDNLSVEDAARRQCRAQRLQQFRKVAIQRLFVAALDQDLIPIAKDQRAKSIPLRFENPIAIGWQFIHSLGQHRQ